MWQSNPKAIAGENTTRMNDKQLEMWAKTRQAGRQRFVWIFGVATWGILTGLMWSIFMAWSKGWEQWPIFLGFGLIGFPIGGYFWGQWMWKAQENAYLRGNHNV